MANIASVLKEEISRIARKEIRTETARLQKSSAQYRSDIAALKRRVAALEKDVARLDKQAVKKTVASSVFEDVGRVRFSAKGFATLRQKLGLSAAQMGTLIGVSAQTVYNWEAEKSSPRQSQMAAIVAVRGIGKREAMERLGV